MVNYLPPPRFASLLFEIIQGAVPNSRLTSLLTSSRPASLRGCNQLDKRVRWLLPIIRLVPIIPTRPAEAPLAADGVDFSAQHRPTTDWPSTPHKASNGQGRFGFSVGGATAP